MRTWLREANPLALLAAGLASVPGSLAVRSLPVALVALAAYALAGALLLSRPRTVLWRVAVVVLGSVSVVWSTWLLGGRDLAVAATAGLRVVLLAAPGAVLAAYVDPARLGDELGQRTGLPARPVVAFTAALQRFEQLGSDWTQLERARRARGLGPGRGPVSRTRYAASMAFGLLVSALRGAARQSVAMDARGFADASAGRTWAEPARWDGRDTVVVVLGVTLAALPVVLSLTLAI